MLNVIATLLAVIAVLLGIIASTLLFGAHVTLFVLAAFAVLGVIVCLINKAQEASDVTTRSPEFQERVQSLIRERQAAAQARLDREREEREQLKRLREKLASEPLPRPQLPHWRRDPVTWAIAGIPAAAFAGGVVMFFAAYY